MTARSIYLRAAEMVDSGEDFGKAAQHETRAPDRARRVHAEARPDFGNYPCAPTDAKIIHFEAGMEVL